jgi:LuxR family transcriptional activator of conjugal transfer of Ti plasmids
MSYAETIAFADMCDDLRIATDDGGLLGAMGRFASRIGFDWFGYVCRTAGDTFGHSSYPAAWESMYVDRGYVEVDPVIQTARRTPLAFQWDESKYPANRVNRNFFGVAADFNVRSGLTVPITGVYGQFAALTLAGPHNDNIGTVFAENLSSLTLAALHYHMHSGRIRELEREANGGPGTLLTARSRVCVTWIARGKTVEETASILNIHEATVRYHLNEARRRLNAISLPHLVAEALRKGEIVY